MQESIKNNTKWEELFDEGFVWEEAAQGMFALFRVCNEADNTTGSYDFRGSRTLAKPEYIKAFIRQLLATKIEIDEVVEDGENEMCRLKAMSNKHLEEDRIMLAYDFDSRYVGVKHFVLSLKQKLLDLKK